MIRNLMRDDLAAIKRVIEAVGLFPPDMLDDMTAPHLSGAAPDEVWLTADDGGPRAIAYAAPERMTEGTWNLLLIAVDPAAQGQGLGARLMRHVEDLLAARGHRVLLVETSGLAEFAGARAFYERLGYQREAVIRDYYRAGEDKIVFRKPLRRGMTGTIEPE